MKVDHGKYSHSKAFPPILNIITQKVDKFVCHKNSRLFDLQQSKYQQSLKWIQAGEISTHFGTKVTCTVEKAILKSTRQRCCWEMMD